jgi:NAD dependent epimerase/dehydratase
MLVSGTSMNEFRNLPVLVTGAGGFIGSHLVERLVLLGADVRAFLRYTSKAELGLLATADPELIRKVRVIRGDLRDLTAVREAVSGVRVVYHLGALIGIPYSYARPKETVETNVLGTLNVLLSVRENPEIQRVVHTSTSEVYGTARYVPMDEGHPLQAQSPYSASKIGADKIADSFFASFDLPVVTLRPFNTYGPRQSARAVIPTIITQALRGEVVSLGSVDPIRDLTFVSDTVEAFVKATSAPEVIGKTVNLGVGKGVSVGDLVMKIGTLLGKKLEIRQEAGRQRPSKSEVGRLISNNELAAKVRGGKPEMALEDGLKATIEWIQHHTELYAIGRYEI